jgi:hypothetical protein
MFDVSKGKERWEEGNNTPFAAFENRASRLKSTGRVIATTAKIVIKTNDDQNLFF